MGLKSLISRNQPERTASTALESKIGYGEYVYDELKNQEPPTE